MANTSCSVKPLITIKPKTISVNGVTIPRDAISRETQNHPAAKPIDAWHAAGRALVVRELLLQEATRLGLPAEPISDDEGRRETDEEAQMRALIEREVATPEPDDVTCNRYYQQNLRRFRSPDLYEVSHILIPGGSNETEAGTIATALLSTLRDDPSAFSALAKAYSACPSREVGGNLGQIGPGQTVPEFEKALVGIRAGCVHPEPIRSRYGLHIVRVDRKIEGQQLPFEIVLPMIASYLAEHVQRTAQRHYIAQLAGRAIIEGITLEAATSPLMQ